MPLDFFFSLTVMHLGLPWLGYCLYAARATPWALMGQAALLAAFGYSAVRAYTLIPGLWWEPTTPHLQRVSLWQLALLGASCGLHLALLAKKRGRTNAASE